MAFLRSSRAQDHYLFGPLLVPDSARVSDGLAWLGEEFPSLGVQNDTWFVVRLRWFRF